ncbi:hypothetical protein SISSUDRAFT_725829 [Sistotremastrum suecicum HHB10207 ss-3]|uniref:Hyaluronan/mRNA-binding protein domain-containing protein n=1 Tax=Sistotremastrum suecicum HHB10207 ss-3 TaxID=1314776 RepID=A0A166DJ90_9AGAM|nr:hypothetical protein SISSUDRAFT_725829 [Sistotremastrum suecicum HHB10207 ss-3]
MTRTERSVYPRAIVKDRSESKTGLDKSIKKNGAGQHSWGSLADEIDHEVQLEEEDLVSDGDGGETVSVSASSSVDEKDSRPVPARKQSISITEEERESARKFRKGALNGTIDLGAIARTSSALSSSPPKSPESA